MWLSGPVAEAYIFPRLCPPAPQYYPPSSPAQDFMFLPFDPPCTPPIPPHPASLCPRGLLLLRLDWRNEEKEEKGRKGREQKAGGYKDSQSDRQKDRQAESQAVSLSTSQTTRQTDRYSKVADMIQLYRRFAMGRSFSTSPQQRRYYVAQILSTPSLLPSSPLLSPSLFLQVCEISSGGRLSPKRHRHAYMAAGTEYD